MAEFLQGVTVHVEIDTNKNTYPLHLAGVDVETARREVAEFFARMADL